MNKTLGELNVDNIYNMDCVEGMKKLPSNSIDLVITSPPYFVNKEYEKTWTKEYYENLLKNVFEQVNRVLKPGSYFVVNFGDAFNSGNRFYEADVPSVYPATVSYFEWGRSVGFDLQATRIWRKQFAKMGIPFVCNKHPRNIFDYEHIWVFRKKNGSKDEFVNDRKLSQRGVIGEDWKTSAGINKHSAAFPIELPEWAINVYSQEKYEVILDPFMGSGTTALAAQKLEKHYIGFELNPDYILLYEKRKEDLSQKSDFS